MPKTLENTELEALVDNVDNVDRKEELVYEIKYVKLENPVNRLQSQKEENIM